MQSRRLNRLLDRPPALGPPPACAVAFSTWRRQVRSAVERLAAVGRSHIVEASVEKCARAGLWREVYVWRTAARGDLTAVVVAPGGGRTGPAVLVCPDLSGPDERVTEDLARAGLVTLAFDYGVGDAPDRLDRELVLCGQSLVGVVAEDALAALAWLGRHPLVRPGRVGLLGQGFGSGVALLAALLSEQPVPLCAAGGLEPTPFLPGIFRYADMAGLFAALAPAPVQLQYRRWPPDRVRAAHPDSCPGPELELVRVPAGRDWDAAAAAGFFQRVLAGPGPSR